MTEYGKTDFDVLVVGSGATGGWACKRLAEAGLKVALVDAGPPQSDKNFTEHMPVFQLKYRNKAPEVIRRTRPIQSRGWECSEYNYKWYCNDLDEPYTTTPNMPYTWSARMRIGGGRTNVWSRGCLRYSEQDFKAASFDGYGVDWPLSYKDLAPYYDLVESYVGVSGQKEGNPMIPDGVFQPPMNLTCEEVLLRERAKDKLGLTVTIFRTANLTKPLNGRYACHYCGPCERGCITHSYFNSSFTTVADAIKSGNCTYVPNAMVWKVLMDSERNRATGLLYIERDSRRLREIEGRVVILCAQAMESVRILLNSSTRHYPNGLANSSGALGHYLMDSIAGAGAGGELPWHRGEPSLSGPVRPASPLVPRFRNLPNGPKSQTFLRGYLLSGSGGVNYNWRAPGFGTSYKQAILEPIHRLGLSTSGEVLARWENYVELDPNVVDIYGIPVLRFHMRHSENEFAMLRDAANSAAEMLEAAGAKNVTQWYQPLPPGTVRHEVGIARMGNDPKTSVLNAFQQSHDVNNLFVMDGASFCSNPCNNPTLTMMALCVRSCDYLLHELKSNSV